MRAKYASFSGMDPKQQQNIEESIELQIMNNHADVDRHLIIDVSLDSCKAASRMTERAYPDSRYVEAELAFKRRAESAMNTAALAKEFIEQKWGQIPSFSSIWSSTKTWWLMTLVPFVATYWALLVPILYTVVGWAIIFMIILVSIATLISPIVALAFFPKHWVAGFWRKLAVFLLVLVGTPILMIIVLGLLIWLICKLSLVGKLKRVRDYIVYWYYSAKLWLIENQPWVGVWHTICGFPKALGKLVVRVSVYLLKEVVIAISSSIIFAVWTGARTAAFWVFNGICDGAALVSRGVVKIARDVIWCRFVMAKSFIKTQILSFVSHIAGRYGRAVRRGTTTAQDISNVATIVRAASNLSSTSVVTQEMKQELASAALNGFARGVLNIKQLPEVSKGVVEGPASLKRPFF
jgi:hypothetical protein